MVVRSDRGHWIFFVGVGYHAGLEGQMNQNLWLRWVRSLRAISQSGIHFSHDPFDIQRYEQVRKIASEVMLEHSNLTEQEIVELNASELGYATPKADVRGAIVRDGKILLVQEVSDHGRWTLPGGWADTNETPGEAVVREVLEESGYQTKIQKIIGVYDREKRGHVPSYPVHVYKLYFLCEIIGGSPRESIETSQIKFFPENELPELSIARVTEELIQRCFEHQRHPEWPTDFD